MPICHQTWPGLGRGEGEAWKKRETRGGGSGRGRKNGRRKERVEEGERRGREDKVGIGKEGE